MGVDRKQGMVLSLVLKLPCASQQDCFETSGYVIPGPTSPNNFEASESRSGGKYVCPREHTNTHTEGEGGRGKERA